jgi:hypothetical protein
MVIPSTVVPNSRPTQFEQREQLEQPKKIMQYKRGRKYQARKTVHYRVIIAHLVNPLESSPHLVNRDDKAKKKIIIVEDGKSSNSIVVCTRVMSCVNPPKVYRNIVS